MRPWVMSESLMTRKTKDKNISFLAFPATVESIDGTSDCNIMCLFLLMMRIHKMTVKVISIFKLSMYNFLWHVWKNQNRCVLNCLILMLLLDSLKVENSLLLSRIYDPSRKRLSLIISWTLKLVNLTILWVLKNLMVTSVDLVLTQTLPFQKPHLTEGKINFVPPLVCLGHQLFYFWCSLLIKSSYIYVKIRGNLKKKLSWTFTHFEITLQS